MWLLLADELDRLFLISESYNLENYHTFSLFVQIQSHTLHLIHDAKRKETLQTSPGIPNSFAGERKIRRFWENGGKNHEVRFYRMCAFIIEGMKCWHFVSSVRGRGLWGSEARTLFLKFVSWKRNKAILCSRNSRFLLAAKYAIL